MQPWMLDAETKRQLERNIRQHRGLYIFNGIMFILLGIVALMSPLIAAEFLDIVIGVILVLSGISQIAVSIATKRHWSYYLSGSIYILAGALMVAQPVTGVLALAIIISIFLLIQGCIQIFTASLYAPFSGWAWVLFSGIVSIALPILIYSGWPLTAIWFLGIVVAVNLMTFGISIIMLTTQLTN